MAYPAYSSLTGTVTYSNGTPIDGYALWLITYPAAYVPKQATIANQLVPQPICDHAKVRIQQGVYDQSARIYQNASIEPPNTKYTVYFYDNNDVQLGFTSTPFVVATSPYTLNFTSPTIPTAPTSPATP